VVLESQVSIERPGYMPSFEEIGESHLKFLKGLNVPYSLATMDNDRHIQKSYTRKPLSRTDYYAAVEKMAEK
jgi:hypothetical protein